MAHELQTEQVEPLFKAATLRARVAKLGKRLGEDLGHAGHTEEDAGNPWKTAGGEEPLLLAILGGSLVFLADLVRAVDRPVRFELMQVGYSEGGDTPGKPNAVQNIHYPIPVEIEGRRVVVLKDVVASGVIEVYLGEQLRQRGAREVLFAALIDMPDERKIDFAVDYGAFTTRREGILVGYGLKHEGRYGNLPYIGRLPPPG